MTNSIEVINLSKKYKDKEAVANINSENWEIYLKILYGKM